MFYEIHNVLEAYISSLSKESEAASRDAVITKIESLDKIDASKNAELIKIVKESVMAIPADYGDEASVADIRNRYAGKFDLTLI